MPHKNILGGVYLVYPAHTRKRRHLLLGEMTTDRPTEEAGDPGDFCAFALQTLRIETACTANTNAGTSRMVK